MNNQLKSAIDKAFAVTSRYEGTNYTGLEGSFDAAGFTFGIWGFNLGQGTLQTLIQTMYKKDKQLFITCCKVLVDGKPTDLSPVLLALAGMSPKDAVAWSLKRQSATHKPLPHWKTVFLNLGSQEEFKEVQRDFGMTRIKKAASYCKKYGLNTERALVFFFDTCVQQGGPNLKTQAKLALRGVNKLGYKARLVMIAEALSEQANPKWAADVSSRRMAIVNGKGMVHGAFMQLDKDYSITDNPLTFDF